jgi:hypothetical protein
MAGTNLDDSAILFFVQVYAQCLVRRGASAGIFIVYVWFIHEAN